MIPQEEYHNVNVTEEQCLEQIRQGEVLKRLLSNPDFQEIIVKQYFNDESIRLVQGLSEPSLQAPDVQQSILNDMKGIGSLQQFLDKKMMFVTMAEDTIREYRASLETEED